MTNDIKKIKDKLWNKPHFGINEYGNLLNNNTYLMGWDRLLGKYKSLKKENIKVRYCAECGSIMYLLGGRFQRGAVERRFCCPSCQSRYTRREIRKNRIREIKDKINKNSVIKERFEQFKKLYIESVYYWVARRRKTTLQKYEDKVINLCLDRLYYVFERSCNRGFEINKQLIYKFCGRHVLFAYKYCLYHDKEKYIKDCDYKLQKQIYGSIEDVE